MAPLFLAACMTATSPSVQLSSPSGDDRGRITVELALDASSRQRGLMGRTELPPGTGMLFVFPDEAERVFWMKDVPIALDMLFARSDGTIVHVAHRVPPCEDDPCALVGSERPAMYVLELAGGEAARRGMEPGGRMELQNVPPARN